LTTSGTYAFQISDAQISVESFARIGLAPPQLTREHLIQARISTNLALLSWSLRGVALWKIVTGTVNLVVGQADYNLPSNLITITEVWYTTPNGNGTGQPLDRFMSALTRTQYAMLPNKLQQGIPTSYWFQRLPTPVLTIWETPSQGAPTYVLNWFAIEQIQDADFAGGQTPDIVYRGYEALCADLAWRLAMKYRPDLEAIRKAEATEAFGLLVGADQENGPIVYAPNVGIYAMMSR